MSAPKTLVAVLFTAASAVLFPRLGWTLFDAYILRDPNGSSGGARELVFVVLFVSAAAVISGLVASVLVGISTTTGNAADNRKYIVSALIAGLILSAGTFLIPRLALHGPGQSLLGDIGSIAVNWAAMSAAVIALTYAAVSHFTNSNTA